MRSVESSVARFECQVRTVLFREAHGVHRCEVCLHPLTLGERVYQAMKPSEPDRPSGGAMRVWAHEGCVKAAINHGDTESTEIRAERDCGTKDEGLALDGDLIEEIADLLEGKKNRNFVLERIRPEECDADAAAQRPYLESAAGREDELWVCPPFWPAGSEPDRPRLRLEERTRRRALFAVCVVLPMAVLLGWMVWSILRR